MVRGSRVEVTAPNEAPPVTDNDEQQTGLVWLKALNASARNWNPNFSDSLMFLKSPRSVRQKPGKRTAPGRSLGSVGTPATGIEKTEVVKNCVNVRGALIFGSPVWVARSEQGDGPRQSAPVGSATA